MVYYKVEAIPHFVAKSPTAVEEARRELMQEYNDFLRFLLTSQEEVRLHFQSLPGDGEDDVSSVEVGYELADENVDLEHYLKTLRRYLRLQPAQKPFAQLPPSPRQLRRKVQMVAVGALDKVRSSELLLLPQNAQPFIDFNPRVLGQSSLTHVALAPLTHMVSSLVRDKLTPEIAYLMPLSERIVAAAGTSRWRNTLATLMRHVGRVTITCKKYTYRDEDVNYAVLCLGYYLGTNADRLSQEDINANTSILRTVYSKQDIYTLEFTFHGSSSLLLQSFMRDTDPEAFEANPTALERELMKSSKLVSQFEPILQERTDPYSSTRSGWRDDDYRPLKDPKRPAPHSSGSPQPGSYSKESRGGNDPAQRYAQYFVLDEIIDLVVPPYTFRDALPGIQHFVPKPFQEPFLDTPRQTASIVLGKLDTGKEVRIPIRDLTRHVFITGASGAGKSNTMMNIVRQLQEQNVPVLIIDPVKRDFEPLMRSMGKEDNIWDFQKRWLRFNPFIPPANITLYAHSVIMAKTLSMLFPTNAVAYEILLSMVKETYLRKLNMNQEKEQKPPLTIAAFVLKTGRDLRTNPDLAPTFDEFLDIGIDVLRASAGQSKPSQWLMDALEHFERRWANLRRSVFSIMLSPARHGRVIDSLFTSTNLLEFGSWFDQNEANSAIALVFSMMYEQRLSDFEEWTKKAQTKEDVPLPVYVALLDEAHRIVPAGAGGGDEKLVSAAKESSTLLSQMIAECRALGQGIIVGEQSASKIDPNVLINTSTKIVHQVLYGRDKEFLSSALSLSPSEQDYLAYLRVGEALTFTTDTYQPLYLRIPEFGKT